MNPTDPNQGGFGGNTPVDPNQGQGDQGQAPVSDPNAGQPAPEAPVTPEAPVSEPTPIEPVSEQPGMPSGDTGMGGDQGGQNPAGGAPVA